MGYRFIDEEVSPPKGRYRFVDEESVVSGEPTFWEQHPTGASLLKAGIEIPAMAIGGIGGAIAGAPTVIGAPVTAALGAGLGYGVAKGLERGIGLERPITTVKEAITTPIREVGEGIAMEATGVAAGKVLAPLAGKVITKTKDIFSPQAVRLQKNMEKIITTNFHKAIQPSPASVGKTFAQARNYDKKTVDSVVNIIEDKPNLSLSTFDGEIKVGSLPESVAQLDEALPQTMKRIYTESHAFAKATGQKGIEVDMSPMIKELEVFINYPNNRIKNPASVRYAKTLAESIRKEGLKRAPEEVEDLIAKFNADLGAFYQSPVYGKVGHASVDNLGVNKLRQILDETIEKATGADYQKLKNAYGSMSAIRKDITKRKIMLANKVDAGFVNQLTNIVSGQQAARGLVTFDPITLATAGVMKGIERFHKFIHSPDRKIKKMFTLAERLIEKSKGLPREGIKKVLEPSASPYKYAPAGLEEGVKMKALSPPKPETWITGEGFAVRPSIGPLGREPQYPPFAGVRVEKPAQVIRKAISEGWTAVKGNKTPLLLVDKSGRQVAWNQEARKFLPVEKPYSAYRLGEMKDVTNTLYGIGGVEGEALPKSKFKKGLYSK